MLAVASICAIICATVSLSAQTTTISLPADSAAGKPQSVGLVLSGGGAKGIAHIGVIQALEDNDIPIDYITGTSMGAIVGGLYAAGYTPQEMMELIESRSFSYWSTGRIDEKLTYYWAEPQPTPAMVHFNLGDRDSANPYSFLPTSLINPLPMNFAFMDLFSAYTAQCGGDFNKLFVPLRTITSDIYTKKKIVLSHGSLGDAIRASMSFPLVFKPIELDGVLVYDGGIYDNYPVNVMRSDFAPAIMIGVNVSGPDKKPKSNDILQQLEDMIIQNNDYDLPEEYGINIKIHLSEFGLLDFPKAARIYKIGYDKAMEMMDSIKARVTSRIPRETRTVKRDVFKSQTPYVRFDSVTVEGGNHNQNAYLTYLFTHNHRDTFGIVQARDAFYRAITPGKISDLLPWAVYNPQNGLFNLHLKAQIKDKWRVGAGGYVSSSTSSMIFLTGGYSTLSFNSFSTNLSGWIGQSYLAGLYDARVNLRTPFPSALVLEAVASRHKFYESDKLFYKDNLPTFITSMEFFTRLRYSMAAGRRGKIDIGVGGGLLRDRYFENNRVDFSASDRDRLKRDLMQAVGRYEYNTLNAPQYPTGGARYQLAVMGVYGKYHYEPTATSQEVAYDNHHGWGQIEASTENYFSIGRHAALGLSTHILASTRELQPGYNASIIDAPAFQPTPSSYNTFNPAFRANQWTTVGLMPIWKISQTVQLRGDFHGFMPWRKIIERSDGTAHYGSWFSQPEFFGEAALIINLPFAAVTAYGNYMSYPARNWNFGISFGIFMLAPRFLR